MSQVQFTEASACIWRWFRSVKVVAAPTSRGSKSEKDIAWQQVEGAEATYVPQEADEGCLLRVECHPPAASLELPEKNGQVGDGLGSIDCVVNHFGNVFTTLSTQFSRNELFLQSCPMGRTRGY